MKSSHVLKAPDHTSYKRHRRQFWIQIMLPVLLGAILFLIAPVVAWVAGMGGSGDLGRWSAISTMWLLIPAMILLIVLLGVLVAVVYLMSQVNAKLPTYSRQVQRFADGATLQTRRVTDMVRSPVLAVRELAKAAKDRIKQLRERG
jgi:heme/copper-type cytochrome/quinol oxidase subunit 3